MIPERCPRDNKLYSPMKCGGCDYEVCGECELEQRIDFCLFKCGEGYYRWRIERKENTYPCIEYICTFCNHKEHSCTFCKHGD